MSPRWDPDAAERLRFVTQGLDEDEVAAVTAVVTAAVHEEAQAEAPDEVEHSGWERSRRALRQPLPRAGRAW